MANETHIPINPTEICYRAFELMNSKQFEDAEKLLTNNMSKVDDDVVIGLFHSALGVLFKLKGEMKIAWRHYQRAERLIPEDPALKIIMARFLIEQFAEYDSAIKRVKKVINQVKENPVFMHQIHITIGLAYIGKGQRTKAREMLTMSMGGDFEGFVSTKNIDFKLVEMLIRKKWATKECETFLNKAFDFAKKHKEDMWITLIGNMLRAFSEESKQDAKKDR